MRFILALYGKLDHIKVISSAQLSAKENSMTTLEQFRDILNNQLFCFQLLELKSGEGETDRLKVKELYNTKRFMHKYSFDDLFIVGVNNALFTDRAKKFINEMAAENNIKVKFMYSQSIIVDKE